MGGNLSAGDPWHPQSAWLTLSWHGEEGLGQWQEQPLKCSTLSVVGVCGDLSLKLSISAGMLSVSPSRSGCSIHLFQEEVQWLDKWVLIQVVNISLFIIVQNGPETYMYARARPSSITASKSHLASAWTLFCFKFEGIFASWKKSMMSVLWWINAAAALKRLLKAWLFNVPWPQSVTCHPYVSET